MLKLNSFSHQKHFIEHEVWIWYSIMDKWFDKIDDLKLLLNSKEKIQAGLICNEVLRNRYVVSRFLVRNLISSVFNIHNEDLEFDVYEDGKPYLKLRNEININFNIAHSENIFLMALRREGEVGIDVEKIKLRQEIFSVGDRFFSYKENKLINSFSNEEKLEAFYKFWTIKEAYAKLRGISMLTVLGSEMEMEADILKKETFKVDNYLFHLFKIENKYLGAFVTDKPFRNLTIKEI